MISGYVELSGESTALAVEEVAGATHALEGAVVAPPDGSGTMVAVELPERRSLTELASRLALARRVLAPVAPVGDPLAGARAAGESGFPAAFRRLWRPRGGADDTLLALGRAYVDGGGTIDLSAPARRYWIAPLTRGDDALLVEVAAVDRTAYARRAGPRLPFRRPISLAPRLARAAANLAALRPGEVVLDPFVGTGALAAEAALLGARVYGIDVDRAMVRGALRNFAYLGVNAEALVQGEASSVPWPDAPAALDAIVTDPPYGRASATVGGAPSRVLGATLARWAERIRPDGCAVVITPGGPPSLPSPWVEEVRVPVRVHGSLTRQFRRYRRSR